MESPSSFSSSAPSSAAGDAVAISPRSMSTGQEPNSKLLLIIGHKARLVIESQDETRSAVECQVYVVHSVHGRGGEENKKTRHTEIRQYLRSTTLPCSSHIQQ